MNKYMIPPMIVDIKKPKILFTNLPNPIGTAVFVYKNGMKKYVSLYYIQKLVKISAKAILFPFKKVILLHYYIKNKHFLKK